MRRGAAAEIGRTRGCFVVFLSIMLAIMFNAPAVAADLWEQVIDVKGGKSGSMAMKKMTIRFDSVADSVVATVDGKPVKVSDKMKYPVSLGEHTKKIEAIYPGPIIVFSGSPDCVWVGNRWVGFPSGAICP